MTYFNTLLTRKANAWKNRFQHWINCDRCMSLCFFKLNIHYCLTFFYLFTLLCPLIPLVTQLYLCAIVFQILKLTWVYHLLTTFIGGHSDSWVGCVLCTYEIRVNVDTILRTNDVILLILLLQKITYLQSFDLRYNGINIKDMIIMNN